MVDKTNKHKYFLSKLKMADNIDHIFFGPLTKDSSFTQEFQWQLTRHYTKSLRFGVFMVFFFFFAMPSYKSFYNAL